MKRGRPKLTVAPCSFCQRTFKRQEHLRRHERTHTQDRPFACTTCDQRFTRKDLLARHVRTAHVTSLASEQPTGDSPPVPRTQDDSLHPLEHQISYPQDLAGPPTGFDSGIANWSFDQRSHGQNWTTDNNMLRGGAGDVFAGVDGFDWLWVTDLYASTAFLPTAFPEDSMMLSWVDQDNAPNVQLQLGDVLLPPSYVNTQPMNAQGLASNDAAPDFQQLSINTDSSTSMQMVDKATTAPFQPDLSSQQPSNHSFLIGIDNEQGAEGDRTTPCPWRLSAKEYTQLHETVLSVQESLPAGFRMPTRHTFSRYLEGYFRGFHEHLPMFHLKTFSITHAPIDLVLSLASVGALYKFEADAAHKLYPAARALLSLRLQDDGSKEYPASDQDSGLSPSPRDTPGDHRPAQTLESPGRGVQERVRLVQSLVALIAMSSWGQGAFVADGLALSSHMAVILKLSDMLAADPMPADLAWHTWIEREERRRTVLAAYSLLNLQCVAFNVLPNLLSREVDLCLPHPMVLWRATTEAEWARLRSMSDHRERTLQSVLGELLSGHDVASPGQISAFGNFVVVHSLVQQIFMHHQVTDSPEESTVARLETALRGWQKCWGSASESTLDPLSSNGPLAFTSTALLRIAYIRLVINLGPLRSVMTRNPRCLAKSVTSLPVSSIKKNPYTDIATLQCIHALGILVRAGVAYVSRTNSQNWSIVHSLSNLECACHLSLWLRDLAIRVAAGGTAVMRDEERTLLAMTTSIVSETAAAVHLQEEGNIIVRIRKLAAFTVRIWADALDGHHVFSVVEVIAEGLSQAADFLNGQLDV